MNGGISCIGIFIGYTNFAKDKKKDKLGKVENDKQHDCCNISCIEVYAISVVFLWSSIHLYILIVSVSV